MFEFLTRRRNIAVLLDRAQPFEDRWKALYALTSLGSHPDSIRAMLTVAQSEPGEYLMAEELVTQIARFNDRDAASALLSFLPAESQRGPTRQLENILTNLGQCRTGLSALGDAAVSPLQTAGRNILSWRRSDAGGSHAQAMTLGRMNKILDSLTSPRAVEVKNELSTAFDVLSNKDVALFLKTALETESFEAADTAIEEIARLDTVEASAALRLIRAMPERRMSHMYTKDDEDNQTGYSPKLVTIERPSSELGQTLRGQSLQRWSAARAR